MEILFGGNICPLFRDYVHIAIHRKWTVSTLPNTNKFHKIVTPYHYSMNSVC